MMEEQSQPAAGVRVVARIRPPDPNAASGSLFKVAAAPDPDSAAALISFHIQPQDQDQDHGSSSSTGVTPLALRRRGRDKAEGGGYRYKLDGCYLKEEPNHHIFTNEVQPLLRHLSSNANANACVVACGAAPANAHLLMGSPSQDQPGLLTLAMAQILQFSSPPPVVRVSSYQVLQDNRILDLLEPKEQEVLVLEDADGATHLKGLSTVPVKSIGDFTRLCCGITDQHKQPTKSTTQLQSRPHQGLVMYVSRFDHQGRECSVSKMNFLDLAGYVGSKQKNNGGGLGLPNSNKSLYALMNVVQALNSNQSFVPYRQSKVTRVLQDSLCKTSAAVLIACLDEVSGQDSVSTISLVSRSSQVVNKQCYNSYISDKSSSKPNQDLSMRALMLSKSSLHHIHQSSSVLDKHDRPKFSSTGVKASQTPIANKRSQPVMHSAKKHGWTLSTSTKMKQKNTNTTGSAMSGRKLFCLSASSSKENETAVPAAVQQAEGCDETENVVNDVSFKMQAAVPCRTHDFVSSIIQEEDSASSNLHTEQSASDLSEICSSDIHDKFVENTLVNTPQPSIKLSDKLREISNSLKLLSTQPVNITIQKLDTECVGEFNTNAPEPKTPMAHSSEQHEDPMNMLEARSTGIKKSLVHECLTFLNSANKEQLKSLKGIGEKRANHILNLREESPVLFKEIDDLKEIIGMNSKEIRKMMSGIIDS